MNALTKVARSAGSPHINSQATSGPSQTGQAKWTGLVTKQPETTYRKMGDEIRTGADGDRAGDTRWTGDG